MKFVCIRDTFMDARLYHEGEVAFFDVDVTAEREGAKPINRHFRKLPERYQEDAVEEKKKTLADLPSDQLAGIALDQGFSESDIKGLKKPQIVTLLNELGLDIEKLELDEPEKEKE